MRLLILAIALLAPPGWHVYGTDGVSLRYPPGWHSTHVVLGRRATAKTRRTVLRILDSFRARRL